MAQEFNVLAVGLQGSKLIEASAGTGKTYSIAILTLRLILEKEMPIDKILMVTFTKAAAAELESRIRKFVRLAYKFSLEKEIGDDTIKEVVGNPDIRKRELLYKAVQSLDNLSVMTIHSFCQRTIDEFTFETNQSFDYEIITDDSMLLKNASNKYFRGVLNIMDLEKFREINAILKTDKMPELLRKHIKGMKFIDSSLEQNSTFEAVKQNIIEKNEAFDAFLRGILQEFNRFQ